MVLERNESAEVRRVMRLLCGLLHHRGGRTRELLCQEFAPRLNEGRLRGLNMKKSALGPSQSQTTPAELEANWVAPEKILYVFNRVFSNVDTLSRTVGMNQKGVI